MPEVFEHARPAAVDILAHLLAGPLAHPLELAMLELDDGRGGTIGNEADFDLGADLGGVGLPLAADVPTYHETMRRLPNPNRADHRLGAVFAQLVPAAAETRLHHDRLHWRVADRMGARKPPPDPGREDLEGMRLARVHAKALAHRRDCDGPHHSAHFGSPLSFARRSTSTWKAASASSQN